MPKDPISIEVPQRGVPVFNIESNGKGGLSLTVRATGTEIDGLRMTFDRGGAAALLKTCLDQLGHHVLANSVYSIVKGGL